MEVTIGSSQGKEFEVTFTSTISDSGIGMVKLLV